MIILPNKNYIFLFLEEKKIINFLDDCILFRKLRKQFKISRPTHDDIPAGLEKYNNGKGEGGKKGKAGH